MKNKFKLLMLSSIVAATLTGCSSDDSETTAPEVVENSAPVLKIIGSKAVTMDENTQKSFSFNILDNDVADTHSVSYKVLGVSESELKGSILLNSSAKTVTYSVGNISEEESFSILLNVKDSAGNEASESTAADRTVSFVVDNSSNVAPEFSFSSVAVSEAGEADITLEAAVEGFHTLVIPYKAVDEDGDEITVTKGELSNLTGSVVLNESKSQLEIKIDEVYDAEKKGSFSVFAFDGQETTSVKFNITQKVTQVSPELEITNKTKTAEGVVPTEIKYGTTTAEINFTKSDKNNDPVYVTAALSKNIADFEPNVIGNVLSLTNISVEEDTLITVTLTATDRTGTATIMDSVELNVLACNECAYLEAEKNNATYVSQYNYLKSSKEEATLINFYTEYLELTDQLTTIETESYKLQVSNNYLIDKNAIDRKISEVNIEFAKVANDESLKTDTTFVEGLNKLLVELNSAVKEHGEKNIVLLNNLAAIDSKLPTLLTNQEILSVSDNVYSKYVGNDTYGVLIANVEWDFFSQYDVLEVINLLSTCK